MALAPTHFFHENDHKLEHFIFHNKSFPTGHCAEQNYLVMRGRVVMSYKEKGIEQLDGIQIVFFLVGRKEVVDWWASQADEVDVVV